MKQLIAAGATFVARSHSHLPNHVAEVMDQAISHDGFSVVEVLSECTEFFPGAFDSANPRKGGKFNLVPKDHDATDEAAAYKLAMADFPGYFGVFVNIKRATKNELEAKLISDTQSKIGTATPLELLQKSFDRFA